MIAKRVMFLMLLGTLACAYQTGGSRNFPNSLSAGDCLVIFSGMHVPSNELSISHVKISNIEVSQTQIAPDDSFRVTMTVENTSDSSKTITAARLKFYNKKFGTTAPDSPVRYEMTDNFLGTIWSGPNINLLAGERKEIGFNIQAKANLARVNPVIIDGYLEVFGQTEDNWWTNVAFGNKYCYASERIASVDASGTPFVESILVSPNPTKAGLVTITINFSEVMDTTVLPRVSFKTAGGATVVVNGLITDWQDGLSWRGTAGIPVGQSPVYDGMATVKVEGVKDILGNLMPPNENVGTFRIDTIAPQMKTAYQFNAMSGTNFDIQAIASEAINPFSLMLEVQCGTTIANCSVFWDSNQGMVTWNGHVEIPLSANVGSVATFNVVGLYYDLAGNANNVNNGAVTVAIEESIPVFEKIYFDRVLVFNGQTVSNRPFVEAYIRHVKAPTGVKLQPQFIRVTVDRQLVIDGESLVQLDSSLFMFDFSLSKDLSLGTHIFEFAVKDSNSRWSRPTTVSVQVVSSALKISQGPLPLPNPFSPNGEQDFTYIVYTLTKSTDISLRIYNLNGDLVWRQELDQGEEGAHAGVNKVIWNGRDSYNHLLPNGVYICYVFQKKEAELKILGKTKIFILK